MKPDESVKARLRLVSELSIGIATRLDGAEPTLFVVAEKDSEFEDVHAVQETARKITE